MSQLSAKPLPCPIYPLLTGLGRAAPQEGLSLGGYVRSITSGGSTSGMFLNGVEYVEHIVVKTVIKRC